MFIGIKMACIFCNQVVQTLKANVSWRGKYIQIYIYEHLQSITWSVFNLVILYKKMFVKTLIGRTFVRRETFNFFTYTGLIHILQRCLNSFLGWRVISLYHSFTHSYIKHNMADSKIKLVRKQSWFTHMTCSCQKEITRLICLIVWKTWE